MFSIFVEIRNNVFLLSGSTKNFIYAVAVRYRQARFDVTKNEEMKTLLISLAYYRSTLIFS